MGGATPPSPAVAPAGKRLSMRPPPWDKSAAEAEPGSFGHWLRRQRELREISLRDIAERTKISLRYLEAMEDDRFDLLPAPVFAKGFLREYARYVGLSPDEVVNHWLSVQPAGEGEHAADGAPASSTVRPFRGEARADQAGRGDRSGLADRSSHPDGSWVVRALVVFGVLIALALVAGAAYYTFQHRGGRKPSPGRPAGALQAPPTAPAAPPGAAATPPGAAAAPAPGAAAPSPPAALPPAALPPRGAAPQVPTIQHAAMSPAMAESTAAPTGEPTPLEVTLDFTRDCWVEVAIDGKKWISEERVPGEALQLQAQEKVVLTLGNPSAVEAQVNGYSFDLPHSRQAVHDLVIDLDTVRTLKDKHEAL